MTKADYEQIREDRLGWIYLCRTSEHLNEVMFGTVLYPADKAIKVFQKHLAVLREDY